MRNRIARFLEWLAGKLRVPEDLEMRMVDFDDAGDMTRDEPAAGVDVNALILGNAPWLELKISKNSYLQISYRSLRRFLRKKVT